MATHRNVKVLKPDLASRFVDVARLPWKATPTEHTVCSQYCGEPGPGFNIATANGSGAFIASVAEHAWGQDAKSIATLIAAAPDLLAALKSLVAADNCNYWRDTMREAGYFDAARAAIAKAEASA